MEEIEITKVSLSDGGSNENSWQELWKKAILNCFLKVDAEIGEAHRGSNGSNSDASEVFQESIAPETVGSTAVVAILCSTHIVVANCGDSRAVLCRGKVPMPLSVDHKVRLVFVVLHLFIGVHMGMAFLRG
jgi:protein phosphatase 2C